MSDLLMFAGFLALVGLTVAWARDFRRAWREGKRRRSEMDRVMRRERAQ